MSDHIEGGVRPRGRSVVVGLYLAVVAVAGVTGYLLGAIGPEGMRPVSVFGVFSLAPTPMGLALYGVVTLGVGLGIALALVAYVSDRYA